MNAPHAEPKGLPVRDLARVGRILRVAAAKGWGHYAQRLHLGPPPEGPESAAAGSDARRFREALEELGPSFIKFGQLLSVRQDLFPEAVIAELRRLQDAVPPFPGGQARRLLEAELGRPVAELFADFDERPFAAASIAQVHAATLTDGTPVVVKVQRPEIEALIQADVEVLFYLARLLQDHLPELRRYDPLGLVEEFAETIGRELDFRLEGRNADRFRENFAEDPEVSVPRIYWELSGRRVLTMARSLGHKAGAAYPADATARRRLAASLARLFLAQLFEHGFFHGDPHPGNVFILEDERWCFHDFGIVGRFSPHDQENLRQLFFAVLAHDADWLADVYFDMGVAAASVDRAAFVRDLDESLERYHAVAGRGSSFAEILHQFIRLGQRHQIRMPREMLLVAKAFMALESLARTLDPAFNMLAAFEAYAPHMVGRALAPEVGWARGYRVAATLRTTLRAFPLTLVRTLQQLEKGQLGLRLRHEQLEEVSRHIDRASNRVSFSLIIAAVVVGSSIVMSFHTGPHLAGIPLVGLIGYVLAAMLGLWWAAAILRSGRL